MANITTKAEKSDLPSPEDFFLLIPLYQVFPLKENGFYSLEYFKGTIDTYCEGCKRHSVFNCKEKTYEFGPSTYKNYIFAHWLTCSRNNDHKIFFLFLVDKGQLQKIGQYPSLADLATPDLQKYRKVLGEERYREFARAVGLASHGVGIGAFVYLRRIFESLIEKAYNLAKQATNNWEEEAFQTGRMDEKINFLKMYLPPFLVENRSLYGILSKGIHSLNEEECLNTFPIVKLGIELILDEELERVEKQEKVRAVQKDIGNLNALLKQRRES